MRAVTFPHMGAATMVFREVMEEMGNRVIMPQRPSRKTLSLGTRYAPEFACLPFKILLGTYIEALEAGADTIVTTGGIGPCRAGQYAQVHERILKDLGYRFEMVVFEPPRINYVDFIRKVWSLNTARLSVKGVLQVIRRGWAKLKALDRLEALSHRIRPREKIMGSTSRAYRRALAVMEEARGTEEVARAEAEAVRILEAVPQRPGADPLRVGMVGEIYVLLEPAANLEIEETLGHLGVWVERSMFLSGWTRDNTVKDSLRTNLKTAARTAARPYLSEMIGGHGQESVGHTVLYAQDGFDGVIQLSPFTCIPEIVAKSILARVGRDLDIPVLSINLDEQTGKAGLLTRLEAFVDLLRRRREAKRGEAERRGRISRH